MKIAEFKGKGAAIKCTTKDEMKAVTDYLHSEVPWAYNNNFRIEAFENNYIFIYINKDGGYTNLKGEQLTGIPIKVLAKDFLEHNRQS